MSTNKYKAAMQNEKFDESRLDELCNLLENYDEPKKEAKPSAKKLRIPFLLAAALVISAIGCTTLAAAGTGLIDVGIYFSAIRGKEAATDTSKSDIEALANSNKGLLDPKITQIFSDGHRAWIEITVDTNNLNMPSSIPDNAKFGFKSDSTDLNTSDNSLPRLPKEDNGIYTFVYDIQDIGMSSRWFVKTEIILKDFGYFVNGKFTALVKGGYSLTITEDIINSAKSVKKTGSPMEVKGVVLNVELSPIGLTVRSSYSKIVEMNLHRDEYYLDEPIVFEFYLRDGTVLYFYDGEKVGALYDLMIKTYSEVDYKTDTAIFKYPFVTPIDIDEVEAITVHGVRFELDYPNGESTDAYNLEAPDISDYFASVMEKYWEHSTKVYAAKDTEKYVDKTRITAVSDSPQSKISPQITAIVGDRHRAWIQMVVDTRNLTIPNDLPANTLFGFLNTEIFSSSYYVDFFRRIPMRISKQDSGVYVFTFDFRDIGNGSHWFTGETELIFENFGYFVNDKFFSLAEGKYSFKITEDMFNTVENSKKISEAMDVKGVMIDLELSPIALVVRGSYSKMEELGLNYYLDSPNIFEFYMRDGSVLKYAEGPSIKGFVSGGLYDLLLGMDGGVEFDTDTAISQHSFSAPIDIDEVEAISVHGVRFELKYPNDESEDVSQNAAVGDNAE